MDFKTSAKKDGFPVAKPFLTADRTSRRCIEKKNRTKKNRARRVVDDSREVKKVNINKQIYKHQENKINQCETPLLLSIKNAGRFSRLAQMFVLKTKAKIGF